MPMAALRFFGRARCPNSKSAPIWNISSTSPIWLMIVIGVAALAPNSD